MIETFETTVDLNDPRNFLSVDKMVAINSEGKYFCVGDTVSYEHNGLDFEIIQFVEVEEKGVVLVITDGGNFYLNSLR